MSLYNRLKAKSGTQSVPGSPPPPGSPAPSSGRRPAPGAGERHYADPYREVKGRVRERLINDREFNWGEDQQLLTEEKKEALKKRLEALLAEEPGLSPLQVSEVGSMLLAEIIGFGPIQVLLDDPEVSEIMINSPRQVYIERKGKLELTGVGFASDEEVVNLIEKIVTPLGRRIDEASPMVDARLPDGSRVNAIIPPLAIKGPSVTIRKFARDPFQVDDLIRFGTLNRKMAVFLESCVKARLNIIVSGGTGSGKTTTLNILSSFIPEDERIVTIEDAAELQLRQAHVVSLETRPPNIEGRGEVTIRQLVKNALRMRPDRIVVGEVRGGETLDMLQAMNTGHDGSLTTVHANGPRDMLSRLETMVLMAGMDLPVKAIREQVASAVDLILQQARLKDGTRRITHITEVQGMEGDVIVLQDLFLFEGQGLTREGKILGQHRSTGIRPRFYERLEASGLTLPADIFA